MAITPTGLTVHTQTGGGTWLDQGSGGGSGLTTAQFLSSTSARGRKFTGVKGMLYEVNAAGTDLSSSIIVIRYLLNGGFGSTIAAGGGVIRVQDTSGNQSDFYIDGSDTYTGGWQVAVIDTANSPSANNGTNATLTAIRYVGLVVDAASASGGDDNFYIDEILSLPNTGLTLGGNTTNVFDELATWDEASLYGIVEKRGPAIFTKAPLILAPDASDHASTDELLIFEEPIYEDGTNVDSALTLQGLSSSDADAITLTRLIAICEDNADINGTHADKELDFASATDITADTCTFRGFNGTTVALGGSGNSYTATSFDVCSKVTDTGAVQRDMIYRNGIDATGAYEWTSNTDLIGAQFFSDGSGYGIDMQSAPTDPTTTDFDNIVANSYGANDTANAFVDNNTGHDVLIAGLNGSSGITVDPTSSTTVETSVQVTFAKIISGSALIVTATADVGSVTSGDILVNEIVTTDPFVYVHNFEGNLTFSYKALRGSSQPVYKPAEGTGTITASGFSVDVNQIPD